MKKITFYLFAILALTTVFTSCKKEEDDEDVFVKNGSFTGAFDGTDGDNKSVEFDFNFNTYLNYYQKQYFYYNSNNSRYYLIINFGTEDGSNASIVLSMADPESADPELEDFYFDWFRTDGQKIANFVMSDYSSTIDISDFSFDEETGKVKFEIQVTGTEYNFNKSAEIEGEVNITLKEGDIYQTMMIK